MSYAPPTLLDLREYLTPITGLSAGNLGIVGDEAHRRRGVSYHLGRDHLISTAYSRQTARDRAGLTNAASAMDIGNYRGLRDLSIELVKACRANAPGTRDIREVIYSPDGRTVLRWDRQRGYASAPREGEADSSHLWHTHISWYRDSETRDKVGVFRAVIGGDTAGQEDSVIFFARHPTPGRFTIPAGARVRGYKPGASDWIVAKTWEPRSTPSSAPFAARLSRMGGTVTPSSVLEVDEGYFAGLYVSTADVTEVYDQPTAPTPSTDCGPAIAAALTAEKARADAIRDAAIAKLNEL